MASSSGSSVNVANIPILQDVQCKICQQVITDPRALFCMHTFCSACLLMSANESKDMICTVCGQPTPLFAGLDGLAKDLDMRQKIQAYQAYHSKPKRPAPPLPPRELSSGHQSAPALPSRAPASTPASPSPSNPPSSLPSITTSPPLPPTPAPPLPVASSSSSSEPAPSASSAGVLPVTANLTNMWKALKGESRYPMNHNRSIDLSDTSQIDLISATERQKASRKAGKDSELLTDVATLALGSIGGGLMKGLKLTGDDDELPPPLLDLNDKRTEDIDLGEGFAAEKLQPNEAMEKFLHWIKKQWFLPSDLAERFSTAEMERLYIPFWVFACRSFTQFQTVALVPTDTFMQSKSPLLAKDPKALEDESVPKEWVKVTGSREDIYDRILLIASDQERLVKFSKEFGPKHWKYQNATQPMSKLPEERKRTLPPALEWQDIWANHTKNHLTEFERKKCKRLLEREAANRKFVRTKKIESHTTYHSFRRRLVWLPIYVLDYYYKDNAYQASVHGLTSRVTGDRPYGLGSLGKSLGSKKD